MSTFLDTEASEDRRRRQSTSHSDESDCDDESMSDSDSDIPLGPGGYLSEDQIHSAAIRLGPLSYMWVKPHSGACTYIQNKNMIAHALSPM